MIDKERKELLDSILEESKKMVLDKSWPVLEDELVEHPGIRDSFEFGFLCGFLHNREQMMKEAVDGFVEEPVMFQWRIISNDIEGEFVVKNKLTDGDKVKMIIIKED